MVGVVVIVVLVGVDVKKVPQVYHVFALKGRYERTLADIINEETLMMLTETYRNQ